MKVSIKTPRVDTTDAADLADTLRSPGFMLVYQRLKLLRQQYVDALLTAETWERVLNLQGSIKAVDRALEIPNILRQEMAAALKEPKR